MKRSVLIYRAEAAATGIFGAPDDEGTTPPAERKPIDSFTINEADVDKARRIAAAFVLKRTGERHDSIQILIDGSISVTLPARHT